MHAAIGALVIAVITNGLGLLNLPAGVNPLVAGASSSSPLPSTPSPGCAPAEEHEPGEQKADSAHNGPQPIPSPRV